jgi:hypothetical protein
MPLSTWQKQASARNAHGFSVRVLANPSTLNYTCTYAIVDRTSNAVKVGRSAGHPSLRLAELQTGSCNHLYLLAYTSTIAEKEAHRRLRKHRRRGEWFDLCRQVLQFISDWDFLDVGLYSVLMRQQRQQ